MQIRFLAGCKRVAMALAIASLVVAPAVAAAPGSPGKSVGGTSLTPGAGNPADDSQKGIEPILYPRTAYVWPFSKGPVYGRQDAFRWNGTGVLHTQVGSFDLTQGMPQLPNELRSTNRLGELGAQYFVLQVRPEAFTSGSFDSMKSTIIAKGGSVLAEIPVAAFIVRMTPAAFGAVRGSGDIIALEPYQPAFKIAPEVGRVPLADAEKATSSVYSLALRLFPGESSDAVATTLTGMGLKVTNTYPDTVFVDADRSKLAAIANLEPVFMIHEVLPIFPMSEEMSTTIQTGRWNNGATPYNDAGIDGGGLIKAPTAGYQNDDQILALVDTGIQMDAADLSESRTVAGVDALGAPLANHRKVAFYGTTNGFGGSGDLLGCDSSTTSGVTHGHAVAVVALGNATKVDAAYGAGWNGLDAGLNPWGLDGVAPKARLVAYDAQVTPLTGRCDDATQGNIFPGNLYTAGSPTSGSLGDGYNRGARISNISWGPANAPGTYSTDASDIDDFLAEHQEAMVFVAAGNTGRDLNGDRIPDPNTIGPPGTSKNAIVVGCSQTSDDLGDPDFPNNRWSRSSNGPATPGSNRIAPLLMAPGQDAGGTGLASTYNCRSLDNDQQGAVDCDVVTGVSGLIATSFASSAAAGAGLLVRDYFAQGFYPDGTKSNPGNAANQVPTISGDLLKAILVASADWMNQPGTQTAQRATNDPWSPSVPDFFNIVGNQTRKFRGNREQGFGRIQLTNALPLQSYPGTPSGMIVGDDLTGGVKSFPNLTEKVLSAGSESDTFNVCDTTQQLTAVIAWTDPSSASDVLSRHLKLKLTAPSGRAYIGNFFTDDVNDNNAIDAGEDCVYSACPWPATQAAANVDTGPWSLPVSGSCVTSCTEANHHDNNNNVQAIFLSADSQLNGIFDDPATGVNEAADNQVEQGTWTVAISDPGANSGAQNYAIAVVGGVCFGSSARVQKVLPSNQLAGSTVTCNDQVVLTIDEIGTPGLDPVAGLTPAEIASRTKVEVLNAGGTPVDVECGVGNTSCPATQQSLLASDFTLSQSNGNNLRFTSRKIILQDYLGAGVAVDPGNGVLEVANGQTLRVTYQDESPAGTADPNGVRVGTAAISCSPSMASGGVVFGQFGKDSFSLIAGGCEKDKRGYFTFGFPDRYMDPGELVSYTLAFQSSELGTTLTNVSISLRAVEADTNSPANCKPGSAPTATCSDPNRTNNPSAAAYLTVLDSPKVYASLPAGKTFTPTFTIQMAASISGSKKVDMLLGISAGSAGKGTETLIAKRETLNADEFALFYSTDYPLGGSEPVGGYDINNNEILETVTTDPSLFTNLDYVFETRTYSNLTSTGTNSVAGLQAPWNFDTCSTGGKCSDDATGFVSGLNNTSRPSPGVFAQWGEDRNFNGRLDGACTGDTTIPCTQGISVSFNCKRCSLNKAHECNGDPDCGAEGTCVAHGTCDFSLGEDHDPQNNVLDRGWSTGGGCGWQTKSGLATGGVWHTGLVRDLSTTICLASGSNPARCQSYETLLDNNLAGDNEWWELLLTPVLNKVNQQNDAFGDPLYQIQILDWAWNMLVDIPDANTQLREEFDTDINKTQGVDLFNDTAFLNGFAGNQGAVSGGNSPITGGFNMFAQISHCLDTDGNGSPDHCGTAAGALCGAHTNDPVPNPDFECGSPDRAGEPILGLHDLSATRGHCTIPPAQKVCTGTVGNCTTDAQCPTNERCVFNWKVCSTNPLDLQTCGGGEGTCDTSISGVNREGRDSCYFEGKQESGVAKAQAVYGLATPGDDDQVNGFCNRTDALSGFDKSKTCVKNCSDVTPANCFDSCSVLGAPYTTCNTSQRTAGVLDQYVQVNGPGRNFGIKNVNGPDMQFTTLEDFYGDTGNQFRGSLEFFTREATPSTPSGFTGFGISVDDMVVSWKETRLDPDPGHCATEFPGGVGLCADLESATGVSFEGNSYVKLTVTDATPYGVAPQDKNDCDGNGLYTDAAIHCRNAATGISRAVACTVGTPCTDPAFPGEFCYAADSTDCNANGTPDVTVKLTTDSPGETTGEIAVLDRVGSTSVYKGQFPYSTLYDSPGTLFVVQSGTQPPNIRSIYIDRNDGTGVACKSNLDPVKRGLLESDTTVTMNTGRITVNAYKVNLMSLCSVSGRQCSANADCNGGTDLCYSCSLLATKPCDPYQTSGTNFCTLASQGVCTPTNDRACTNPANLGAVCTTDANCSNVIGACTSRRGDADGFADTSETVALQVQFANKAGIDVDDLTATLGTNSPNIDCISRSAITVGTLANGALSVPRVCVVQATQLPTATTCTTDNDCVTAGQKCGYNYLPFVFKIANVNRTSLSQVLQAPFTITMRSNKFDALTRATTLVLDLDLNASGSASTNAWLEDFEGVGGFPSGKFQLTTLDANKNSIPKSNGYRCQYNDPFGLNSNDPYPSNIDCFLGFSTDPTAGVNDWHIHKSTDGGMGRAFNGVQSAHWGVHLSSASPTLDTYKFKQLDAITAINPINMPLGSANPELNFAQQVSFIDNTSGVNVTSGESPDRGVVEVQLASTGVPQGNWIKIYPFVNVYDQQGTDDFTNCVFDPIDDGNDEKSFFDPTDPSRAHGPSSTCYPEFNFVRQGQTDYRKTFDINDIGLASDGPGLQGCSGAGCLPANTPAQIFNPGTWVRPRFSLAAFAGRTIRIRFVSTTIDLGQTATANLFFGRGDVVGDDGWYIDDVRIDQALSSALTLVSDAATVDALAACTSCGASSLTAALDVLPATAFFDGRKRLIPGQVTTLDARASTVLGCLNGVAQYQFWTDGNALTGTLPNGVVGDAGDNLLRDWSETATLLVSPAKPAWWDYGVKIRCSTNATCGGTTTAIVAVIVDCAQNRTDFPVFPSAITVNKASLLTVEPDSNTTVNWTSPSTLVDILRGNLITLKARGGRYFTSELACTDDINATSLAEPSVVPTGGGFYYLARAGANVGEACNEKPTYSDGSATELPGRDVSIAQDPVIPCP